jgi:hypothetical protein
VAGGVASGLKTHFRVVMVYDDFTSGKRAMNTCNFLACRLGGGIELRTSMWKFDVLRNAGLRRMAVDDAVEADVIIVANAPRSPLPDEVKGWIEAWVPGKKGGLPAALVALMDFTDEVAGESREAQRCLKEAAAAAGIDFLSQEIRSKGVQLPHLRAQSLLRRSRAARSQPNGPPPEAWGLND